MMSQHSYVDYKTKIDVHHMIGKLHEKHCALVDKWIPFDSCFNIYKYLLLEKPIATGLEYRSLEIATPEKTPDR